MRLIITLVCRVLVACGGGPSSPTVPSPVSPPTQTTWTLTGQIINSLTQAVVGGARLMDTATDDAGLFAATGSGS